MDAQALEFEQRMIDCFVNVDGHDARVHDCRNGSLADTISISVGPGQIAVCEDPQDISQRSFTQASRGHERLCCACVAQDPAGLLDGAFRPERHRWATHGLTDRERTKPFGNTLWRNCHGSLLCVECFRFELLQARSREATLSVSLVHLSPVVVETASSVQCLHLQAGQLRCVRSAHALGCQPQVSRRVGLETSLTQLPAVAENPTPMETRSLPRLMIEQLSPVVDEGAHPIKRLVGEAIPVGVAIFKDGHDLISAKLVWGSAAGERLGSVGLRYEFNPDHWFGQFSLDEPGMFEMWVEAFPDHFGTWRRDLRKRLDAEQDIRQEFLAGAALVSQRVSLAPPEMLEPLTNAAKILGDETLDFEARRRVAFSDALLELMDGPLSEEDVGHSRRYPIRVDRREAGFAAWYELFPRSAGTEHGKHGTLKDTEARIPEIAAMGFDVLYLPPVHPIGVTHRKGRNNQTSCEPGDVGSPWAIGSVEGGHTAIHPELGSLDDFHNLVQTAADFGIEIALDIAFQCSPDHPWVTEHPDWFFVRPDGTIRYAENPPKKYEDIYPINFWSADADALWAACRDVFLFWVEQGVSTFRVDNPHTKPLSFWQWCIDEVQRLHPQVVFLSESFTRPNRMNGLAKLGFTQSYTYFTWKNSKVELTEYLTELAHSNVAEYYRPNFFANTPDILHEYLQTGGPPAFRIRLLLAATLSPLYGIYSGFELCENAAVRPGSEEYLDSEKYEIRVRDWNAPGNIRRDVSKINRIRRSEPALSRLKNLVFCECDSPDMIAFLKLDDSSKTARHLLVVVNLDPHAVHETTVHVPLERLGLAAGASFSVSDLLSGNHYTWSGRDNYVRLDPHEQVGHLFLIERS